jgi:hypothetical protein
MTTLLFGMKSVTDGHERQYARKFGRMSPKGDRTAIGSVAPSWHPEDMDAYTPSSASSRRASWCVRLARRICDAVRELHFATKRASELMLRYGLAESDQPPDTYAEFLLRTRGTVRHEPPARRRSAGSRVR